MVGLTRVVTTVQTTGFYSKVKDQPEHPFSTCNHGKGFYTDFGKAGNYIFDGTTVKVKDNPIVAKLSDMRIINGELENLVFAPRKEFISMAALVVLNIPLLYFLNKDWYAALMTTVPGKAVLAVCAAAIFLSFARVVKLTQPIEYRR